MSRIAEICQAAIDHPSWDINVEDELGLVIRHESGLHYEVGITYGQTDGVKQWSTTFWTTKIQFGDEELDDLLRTIDR